MTTDTLTREELDEIIGEVSTSLARGSRQHILSKREWGGLFSLARRGLDAGWRPISDAPKGGGAENVNDPNWVEPPSLLLRFPDDKMVVCYWDWYYAEGGDGYGNDNTAAWIAEMSGELAEHHYGKATHYMPLPTPPEGG